MLLHIFQSYALESIMVIGPSARPHAHRERGPP
jgi:hypothetical protein